MKLCATVFAFHHRPIAISGMDGNTTRAQACRRESATNTPSLAHTRGTASDRARTTVVEASFMTALLRPGSLLQREHEALIRLQAGVLRGQLRHAVVNRIDVRVARRFGHEADPSHVLVSRAEADDLAGARDLLEVGPFTQADVFL